MYTGNFKGSFRHGRMLAANDECDPNPNATQICGPGLYCDKSFPANINCQPCQPNTFATGSVQVDVCATCPINATVNTATACACDQNFGPWYDDSGPSIVLVCEACPTNATSDGTAFCACAPNFEINTARTACEACPTNATSDGTVPCACAANFQINTARTACEACPTNATSDGTVCACAENFQVNTAGTACEACPTNATSDGTEPCACPAGQALLNGACAACPNTGETVQNGACACENTGETVQNGACACPADQILQNGACAANPNSPATQILAVTISKPFNANLLNPATADFKNLKLSLEADLKPLLCDLVAFPLCEVEVLGFSSGSTVASTQVKNSSPASVTARQATIASQGLPQTGGTVTSATAPTTTISTVGTDCTSSDAVCNGEGQRCKAEVPKTCECNAPNFVSDGGTGCKQADQCETDSVDEADDAKCKAADATRPVCKDKKCIPKSKSAFFIVVFPVTFDAAVHDTPAKKTALKGLLEPKLCAGITSGSCTIVESSIKLKAGSTEVSFEAQVPDLDSTPSAETLRTRLVGVTDDTDNSLGKSTTASGTPTDFQKCSSTSKCAENEGDCDDDDGCNTGLKCGVNNCGPTMDPLADCCYSQTKVINDKGTNTDGEAGNLWTYCTDKLAAKGPGNGCAVNEGDCDNDDECAGDLVCGRNSCDSTFNAGFDKNNKKFFPSGQADCCITKSRALFYGIPSRKDLEEDFQNDDEPF